MNDRKCNSSGIRFVSNSEDLRAHYRTVRSRSEAFIQSLEPEDCVIQSMPDVSPTRWHLAHTTWFFETFVLARAREGYQPFHPDYGKLFNSYYNSVGTPFPRERRGLLSRPTLSDVLEYRKHVDALVNELFDSGSLDDDALLIVELGLQHEEQHQELMHTDIKHVLYQNPLLPAFHPRRRWQPTSTAPLAWSERAEGLVEIGHANDEFCYDIERPRHRVFLEHHALANRLVTSGEYLEFMEDGGYRRPELWLAEGWRTVEERSWNAPLYWTTRDRQWSIFTLEGLRSLRFDEPVCHVSYFEADAYARWAGARLPREAEWEVAAEKAGPAGNLPKSDALHPTGAGATAAGRVVQLFGDLWQWTESSYSPYPGYRPVEGPLGEYNGKFMCNQYVLRGGSCVTSPGHSRPSYRNFLPADARWQFSGIRLAR